jgi:outer membrane protein assembly factor BamB
VIGALQHLQTCIQDCSRKWSAGVRLLPAFCAVAVVASLTTWLLVRPVSEQDARVPVADGPGASRVNNPSKPQSTDSAASQHPDSAANVVSSAAGLTKGSGVRSKLPGCWPRFRGKESNGISVDDVPLSQAWPAGGPKVLWSVELGQGYAGASVNNGAAYVLDYDKGAQCDVLRCLSLDDGKEIWKYSYPAKVKPNHGMSRAVPAVTERFVVSIGPLCNVNCVDALSGELLWSKDLVREFNATVPEWYNGQCPLIDDDKAIIAPAGDTLMIAVDCKSGNVLWRTPNPKKWGMTHSSIMPMNINGKRTYVYCAKSGVVGISAGDGTLLWEYDKWTIQQATIASPVCVGDGLIFFSGGYGSGALLLEVKEGDGKCMVSERSRLKPNIFGSYQHTPIFYQGNIYGVRPDGQMVCLDLEGKVVWSSGKDRFGKEGGGPYTIANGQLFALDDNGLLTTMEATSAGYKQLAQSKILKGPESWAPIAITAGRLFARDLNRMVCLDVSKEEAK